MYDCGHNTENETYRSTHLMKVPRHPNPRMIKSALKRSRCSCKFDSHEPRLIAKGPTVRHIPLLTCRGSPKLQKGLHSDTHERKKGNDSPRGNSSMTSACLSCPLRQWGRRVRCRSCRLLPTSRSGVEMWRMGRKSKGMN